MKQFSTALIMLIITHTSYSQACGIYRIKFIGSITSEEKKIISIYLPTTNYLHSPEKEFSKISFIETNLKNGKFEQAIRSQLTTPFNNISHLISFYKLKAATLKIRVKYMVDKNVKESFFEIDWDDINVSIVEDGNFGTLFEFNFGEIKFG